MAIHDWPAAGHDERGGPPIVSPQHGGARRLTHELSRNSSAFSAASRPATTVMLLGLSHEGVEVFTTAQAPPGRLEQLRALIDQAFDGDFSDDDWEHTTGGWHAVALDGDVPVAHAAVVERVLEVDGHPFRTGYVEGVGTLPSRQGHGLGTIAMTEVMAVLRSRFELGALSSGLHRFYERIGWERWQGPASVRDGDRLVRTPEEDDGIMVLRFGPSLTVDLHSAISCEARRGDDW